MPSKNHLAVEKTHIHLEIKWYKLTFPEWAPWYDILRRTQHHFYSISAIFAYHEDVHWKTTEQHKFRYIQKLLVYILTKCRGYEKQEKKKQQQLRNSSWLNKTRELFQLHAMNDPGSDSRSIMAIVRPISKIWVGYVT